MWSNWEMARQLQRDLKRLDIRTGAEVVRIWKQAYGELERDMLKFLSGIEGADGTISRGSIYQAARATNMVSQVEKLLAAFGHKVDQVTHDAAMETARAHLPGYAKSMEAILPPGLHRSFDRLWPQVVAGIVNRQVEGATFSQRIGAISAEETTRIFDELAIGAAKGESIPKLADRLQKTADMARYRAEMIARTEVIRASNDAASWTYDQYADVIKNLKRMASLDDRCCLACVALDGEEYPLGTTIDDHVLGRCVLVASTWSWEELGYSGIDEPPTLRRARDPYSGENQIAAYSNAREWFEKGLDQATQMRMLGPTRYALWKAGRIRWEDMAGAGSKIVPLRDLRAA